MHLVLPFPCECILLPNCGQWTSEFHSNYPPLPLHAFSRYFLKFFDLVVDCYCMFVAFTRDLYQMPSYMYRQTFKVSQSFIKNEYLGYTDLDK